MASSRLSIEIVMCAITSVQFAPSGADLIFELYTGSDPVGTGPSFWSPVSGSSFMLTESIVDNVVTLMGAGMLGLSDFAQLRVSSITTQPTGGEFNIDMTVRTRS